MKLEDFCRQEGIVIMQVPFTMKVKGFLYHSESKDCKVLFLNSNYSEESRKKTLKHELLHYLRNDQYTEIGICECESAVSALLESGLVFKNE